MKKQKTLLIGFAAMFLVFSVIVLVICGISTYNIQTKIQSRHLINSMTDVSEYICLMMEEDGAEFAFFQDYFIKHPDTLRITTDVSDWADTEAEFFEAFHREYPGRTLESDMDYSEMSDELQALCVVYNYKYWTHMMLEAVDKYGLEYVYYVTPAAEKDSIYYIIDPGPETFEEDGKEYRKLGVVYPEDPAEHRNLWKTWETGNITDGFDEYDNEYGHTYVFYYPVVIDGVKLGMVGSEIQVDSFNKGILDNTLRQLLFIALILIAGEAVLIFLVNKRYISRVVHLSENVKSYGENKDPAVAKTIDEDNIGNDEISFLASQTSSMIREIDSYMTFLRSTTIELSQTKEEAARMNKLATKDALTGIRNKTAYDEEIGHLKMMMDGGLKKFGIAMVDLNYLKKINDTYGHEKGNISIVTVCKIVCTVFEHSPVFRIGGDEFVIILTGYDFEHIEELNEQFINTLKEVSNDKNLAPWEAVSAAIGYAKFDPDIDKDIESVFKRADEAMYEQKKSMHAMRE
ncbi:MAG: GGDEF domain-containing protein [Lachnospiraceae bacterium]|nr:GGDEF domain-containing protein [Lachnospiraceae bacterium]